MTTPNGGKSTGGGKGSPVVGFIAPIAAAAGGPVGWIIAAAAVGAVLYLGSGKEDTSVRMVGNVPMAYLDSKIVQRYGQVTADELVKLRASYARLWKALPHDSTGSVASIDSTDIWLAKMRLREPGQLDDIDSIEAIIKRPLTVKGDTYPQYFSRSVASQISGVGCSSTGRVAVFYDPFAVIGLGQPILTFLRTHEMGHLAYSDVACTPGVAVPTLRAQYSERAADCWADSVLMSANMPNPIIAAATYFQLVPRDSSGKYPSSRTRAKYLYNHCRP